MPSGVLSFGESFAVTIAGISIVDLWRAIAIAAGVIKWFATGVHVGASSDDRLYGPLGHLVSPNQETESPTSHPGARVYRVCQKSRALHVYVIFFMFSWA